MPFAGLLIGLSVLFGVLALQLLRRSAIENASNELRILSVTLSRQVGRQLDRIETSLTTLESHGVLVEELKKPVPARDVLEDFLSRRLELLPLFDDFAIYNRNGICIASTNEHWYGLSGKQQSFFTTGFKSFNFSDVFTSDEGKIQLVSAPIFDGSQVRGVIVGQVNLSSIYDLMDQKLGASDSTDAFLVDAGLRFITPGKASDDTQLESHLMATPILQHVNREFWVDQYQNFEGEQVLGTAHKLPGRRWYVVVEREMGVIMHPMIEARVYMAFGFLALVVVLVLLTLLLTRSITRPIRMLVDSAQKVASGNVTDPILIPQGIDELTFFAQEFDKMRIKVRAFQERMEERLAISERQRLENERLAALGSLASTLAHEIRNPLNAMSLLLSRLGGSKTTAEQREYVVSDLRSEIGRLDRLVGDILDYARPIQLNRSPLDLRHVLTQICDFYQDVFLAHRIVLELNLPESEVTISGDIDRLKQCFVNLVQNAVDVAPQGSVISIGLSVMGDGADITMADEGSGINVEVIERIFDLFFTTKEQGTGLGLSTVKKVIDAHHGRVQILNRTDRVGALVKIWLPLYSQV